MEVLAAGDFGYEARKQAIDAILAAGPAGAEAIVAWLEFPETDPRFEAAVDSLSALGIDGLPTVLRLIEASPSPTQRAGALEVLLRTAVVWSRSAVARRVAEAAWALADSSDARAPILEVVALAGREAAHLLGPILDRLEADPSGPWMEDVDAGYLEGACFADVTPRLVALLESEDLRGYAQQWLVSVASPSPECVVDVLRRARDVDDPAREQLLRVVATWAAADESCASAARDFLAGADPRARLVVLEEWASPTDSPPPGWRLGDAEVLAAARLLLDADEDVCDAADGVIVRALNDLPDPAETLGRAIDAADPVALRALWTAARRLGAHGDALLPRMLRAFESPDAEVRFAALEALGAASEETCAAGAAAALPLLDDPDVRVRALAAAVATAGKPPRARIAEIVREVTRPGADVALAQYLLAALLLRDVSTARDMAVEMLPSCDDVTLYIAAQAIVAGPPVDQAPPGAIDRLVRGAGGSRGEPRTCFAALVRLPGGVDAALPFLRNRFATGDRESTLALLEWIVEYREIAGSTAPLLRELAERDEYREHAECALAALDPDRAAGARRLVELLQSPEVRTLAGAGIVALGADGARALVRAPLPEEIVDPVRLRLVPAQRSAIVDAVQELAISTDPRARARAAGWVPFLPVEEQLTLWPRLVADSDRDVRRAALDVKYRLDIGLERRAEAMAPLLGDEDADVRAAAVDAFESVDVLTTEVSTTLRALLDDPDRDVRSLAAAVLVLHDEEVPDAVTRLLAPLQNTQKFGWDVASDTSARALAKLGPAAAAAAPTLSRALARSGSDLTQLHLIQAIGAIGPAAAECVPILRFVLESDLHSDYCIVVLDSGEIRTAAIEALGAIGPAASPALPELGRLTRDPYFGDAARDAITRIRIEAGSR